MTTPIRETSAVCKGRFEWRTMLAGYGIFTVGSAATLCSAQIAADKSLTDLGIRVPTGRSVEVYDNGRRIYRGTYSVAALA